MRGRIARWGACGTWATAASAFWTATVLAACSSSSGGGGPGTASVTGTIQGMAIPATGAVGLSSVVMNGSMTESAAGAIITNVASACSVLQNHGNPSDASTLVVAVAVDSGSVAPGKYDIVSQGFGATASYALSQSCVTQLNETATSGTVTISSVGSSVSGSFDLMFGSDHVTGTFSAPVCSYTPVTDGGAATCM